MELCIVIIVLRVRYEVNKNRYKKKKVGEGWVDHAFKRYEKGEDKKKGVNIII